LIAQINRCLIAGAVGLSGPIVIAAAHAFHGHTVARTAAAPASTPQPAAQTSDDDGGLQQPPTTPAPAAHEAPSPVVSGGS
jgi:hypothetical protein